MWFKIAGSGVHGTMIRDSNGKYDLDYQIILTHNSPCYRRKDWNPTKIKDDFFRTFQKHVGKGERFENSTTAITLVNDDKTRNPYSIDFVIM